MIAAAFYCRFIIIILWRKICTLARLDTMDRLSKEQRRKNMQAVKSTGSKIERLLASTLRKNSLRFLRNYSKVKGKPDIVFPSYQVAVFCDSEFWHGKNWKAKKKEIKSNKAFWYKKITDNIKRDREVNRYLKRQGWSVIRFWGKDILKDPEGCVRKIEKKIHKTA